MITSRRDYILRIIDEISRMIARVVFKRRAGADDEALEIVIEGFERLFNLERNQLFQFTPDQQMLMLTLDEPPEIARDKLLIYAALSAEAGRVYDKMGNRNMSRATFVNGLRFALKARAYATDNPLPDFAPKIGDLVASIGENTLPPDLAAQLPKALDVPPSES